MRVCLYSRKKWRTVSRERENTWKWSYETWDISTLRKQWKNHVKYIILSVYFCHTYTHTRARVYKLYNFFGNHDKYKHVRYNIRWFETTFDKEGKEGKNRNFSIVSEVIAACDPDKTLHAENIMVRLVRRLRDSTRLIVQHLNVSLSCPSKKNDPNVAPTATTYYFGDIIEKNTR